MSICFGNHLFQHTIHVTKNVPEACSKRLPFQAPRNRPKDSLSKVSRIEQEECTSDLVLVQASLLQVKMYFAQASALQVAMQVIRLVRCLHFEAAAETSNRDIFAGVKRFLRYSIFAELHRFQRCIIPHPDCRVNPDTIGFENAGKTSCATRMRCH